jgi:hypothetical protein
MEFEYFDIDKKGTYTCFRIFKNAPHFWCGLVENILEKQHLLERYLVNCFAAIVVPYWFIGETQFLLFHRFSSNMFIQIAKGLFEGNKDRNVAW